MGLFDKMKQAAKDATGLGLNAQEQYQRAYQKGVFVKDFGAAAKSFSKAAEKFAEDSNQAMAERARANAALYALLASKDRSALTALLDALASVPEIEQIGSDTEMVKASAWENELRALQLEFAAENVESLGEKKAMYQQAGDLLMGLGNATLNFADKLDIKGPADKALPRGSYDAAMSDYFGALIEVKTSPASAHDYMQKAAVRFRQAGSNEEANAWAIRVNEYVGQVKEKRHCWMCGREMQGRDIFFKYYPAAVQPYHRKQAEATSGDMGMFEKEDHVTLCTVCGSAVETQADRYATMRAQAVRDWAEPLFDDHRQAIDALFQRVKALERVAHTH